MEPSWGCKWKGGLDRPLGSLAGDDVEEVDPDEGLEEEVMVPEEAQPMVKSGHRRQSDLVWVCAGERAVGRGCERAVRANRRVCG